MLQFGAGVLYGTRNDIAGQTPTRFAVLQDVSFDLSFTEKPLMGQNQLPELVARGEGKWSGKAKSAVLGVKQFNNIFFGQSVTTGQIALASDEVATVPASSPYVIVPENSASWSSDQGVTYPGSLGLSLTATSGAPAAAGQYEPSASQYVFSSSDAGKAVLLNYLYTLTTGEQIDVTNQQLGTTPTFSGVFRNRDPKTGLYMTMVIAKMTCSKLSFGSKTSDWTIPEFDLTIMDNGSGGILTLSYGDVS